MLRNLARIRDSNQGRLEEKIFIPFYTTKKEGSGIGLSISRQIMRQHNGTIDLLRSDVNQRYLSLNSAKKGEKVAHFGNFCYFCIKEITI